MSRGTGPQLIEFGGKGKCYWGQFQCPECKAWLREMPDHYEACPSEDEDQEAGKTGTLYVYYWTCLKCGHQLEMDSYHAPGDHSPHPDGVEHEPGSYPPPTIRDPEDWKDANHLSSWEKKLVVYCWEMLDLLDRSPLIHKISYIWNLIAALKKHDIKAVKRTAKEYVDLLDHEQKHGLDPGSYGGDEGDVTKIRKALIQIGN